MSVNLYTAVAYTAIKPNIYIEILTCTRIEPVTASSQQGPPDTGQRDSHYTTGPFISNISSVIMYNKIKALYL